MKQDDAEVIALNALAWIAGADLLDTFQSSTGVDRDTIRQAAQDPELLGAVLDFVMMDDDWVQGVCRAQSLRHETFLAARAALPGGQSPHWT
ncbi:DUF3572 domain-containing protein [Jannaschia rubra]|uniref:DUF3572 domain-containing protein n=1 Tax=Jannaschia rubra TaxID=282197 RepID=A0A0M6XLQ8_9RHOB|nr:DUF3572 domain-containing protein [Jannaschia rubra]CTQ32086.1 hypothetical protein JAN5088_00848 [Jannaschia rubra]SFG37892.1 Protein of unknown function [Jannaschia rubra]